MKELDTLDLVEFKGSRNRHTLIVCDEGAITCDRLAELVAVFAQAGNGAVLMMLENQYQRGLRGWAKAQILAAVAGNIEGVVAVSPQDLKRELMVGWKDVLVPGPVVS